MSKHVITIDDLPNEVIAQLLARAAEFEANGYPDSLSKKIIATAFFEPSTRTRLSFESAALRLGAKTLGFTDAKSTSSAKGESLEDTARMLNGYADAIVMRHPEAGAAKRAAAVSDVPVLNAGDGANAHPTQTLVDLFAIQNILGRIDNFTIMMVGDMKYSRVAHSLAQILFRQDNVRQIWVAPPSLAMPDMYVLEANDKNVNVSMSDTYRTMLPEADIVMMTRVQEERFDDSTEYEKLKDFYILHPEELANAKPSMRILSPLPRRYELPESIDATDHAYYFQQAKGAVAIRAALLEYVLQD